MRIAYLVNRYPAVSHSFVRREIIGIERLGHQVARFSIRVPDAKLPDHRDQDERGKTEVILDQSKVKLAAAALGRLVSSPGRSIVALKSAWRMAPGGTAKPVRAFAYFAEACWLASRLRRDGVEHLHAHFGTNPAAIARLTRLLGGPPYSFTAHGPDEFDAPIALDLQGKVADSKFACAISSYGLSQMMRWSHYADWNKLAVTRCGVDASFLAPPEVEVIPKRNRRLCCVARLSGQKGIPLLIDSIAILAERGVRVDLDLLGDGELRQEIEATIVQHGLGDQIILHGQCSSETVRTHLSSAHAMVLASFAEGLPVVIMEAFALGTPVIATRIAGIPELVNTDCGWLVAAGSAEALADAIETSLAADDERLAAMGAAGRAKVVLQHDADINARYLAGLMTGRSDAE